MIAARNVYTIYMIVDGKNVNFQLSVPLNMSEEEIKEQVINNYSDYEKLVKGDMFCSKFQEIKVDKISRNVPIFSLEIETLRGIA